MSEEKLNQILEIIPKKSKNELIKMLQQSVKFDYDKRIVIAIESALNALKTVLKPKYGKAQQYTLKDLTYT